MSRQEAYWRQAMPEPIAAPSEGSLRAALRELIRKTVEEMPSGLLEDVFSQA